MPASPPPPPSSTPAALPEPAAIGSLLVPLDGSPLAEAALPAACALAASLPARLTLLHVLERAAPATVHGHPHLGDPAAAEAYLADVASRLSAECRVPSAEPRGGSQEAVGGKPTHSALGTRHSALPVATHVHPNREGNVAKSIADHAAELGTDMIVLCAHGAGGARGWLAGVMAQQVIRRSAPPVLLVRPLPDGGAPPFAPGAVLVALDGTATSAAALPPALALARAMAVPLELAAVAPTSATIDPGRAPAAIVKPAATAAALDLEAEALAAHLDRLASAARAEGIDTRARVLRGDPAPEIAAHAARLGSAVLVLATHGRGGLDAVWSGSVGSRVVARVAGPLLLVHPA